MNYKIIASKDNSTLRLAKSLTDKKGRKQSNLMLVEGKKMIADLLKLKVKIHTIFFSNRLLEYVSSLEPPPETQLILLEKNLIFELTHQTTSQEIVAVVDIPKSNSILPNTNFIVLDGLQDAGNVGTILRTALGANFLTVYLIDCVDISSPKVVDSSMTAMFHLNLVKIAKADFIDLVKENKMPVYSADLDGICAYDFMPPKKIMGIVIGNEGNGVSNEINAVVEGKITIPMNNKIESLNASVSAGIMMYLINMKQF